MKNFLTKKRLILITWLVALVGTLGSLLFSLGLGFAPCVLCWYQRIMLYPLAVILLVGFLEENYTVYRYVLPLSLIGAGISIYHNLLFYGLIPHSVAPCTAAVSCSTRYLTNIGFVSIPLLALVGFVVIVAGMVGLKYKIND